MKVGMYYNNKDVRVEEMPIPEIGPFDILVKVMACGICGSDIMEWYRIKKAPIVLGHEVTGEIVKAGENVEKYKEKDRVFVTHHVPCLTCHYCLTGHETACEIFQTKNNFYPGGFSQYLKVSGKSVEIGIIKLPDEVSYEEGSFIEPLGTVIRGIRKIELKPAETVLVLGSGIAGLLYIKLAKAFSAGKIIATDINDYRLKMAKKFGADDVFHASENIPSLVKKVNDGRLADKVIICSGALSCVKQALESVDKGGTILFFAVPPPGETVNIDFNPYWRNDISFKTTYGATLSDNNLALELIRKKIIVVDDLITDRLPLDEIQKGFKLASEGKETIKVIINPNLQ